MKDRVKEREGVRKKGRKGRNKGEKDDWETCDGRGREGGLVKD